MFSLHINGADTAEALRKLAEQLDQIVVDQPVHALDRDLVLDVSKRYLDALHDDDGHDVIISVSGDVRTDARAEGKAPALLQLGVRAYLSEKPPAAK